MDDGEVGYTSTATVRPNAVPTREIMATSAGNGGAVTRARASILKPGSMILQQPHVPIPIQIRFPFPSWATRSEEAADTGSGGTAFEAFERD